MTTRCYKNGLVDVDSKPNLLLLVTLFVLVLVVIKPSARPDNDKRNQLLLSRRNMFR